MAQPYWLAWVLLERPRRCGSMNVMLLGRGGTVGRVLRRYLAAMLFTVTAATMPRQCLQLTAAA